MSALPRRKRGSSRAAGTRPRHLGLVLGLAFLAAAQLVVLGARARALGPAPDFLTDGDDISMLSLRLVNGTLVRLGDGRRTLLLAFDPECPHTREVVPASAEWLAAVDAGDLRILAIAPGSPGPAEAYALEMGWRVPVATLEGFAEDTVQMVTGRVPWAIAVDGDGVVVTEDHGGKLDEVAGAIRGSGDPTPEA